MAIKRYNNKFQTTVYKEATAWTIYTIQILVILTPSKNGETSSFEPLNNKKKKDVTWLAWISQKIGYGAQQWTDPQKKSWYFKLLIYFKSRQYLKLYVLSTTSFQHYILSKV